MERLFPIFVKLRGRRVLVVGGGKVAEGKILGLLDTGATIQVVALEASQRVREWATSGRLALEERGFQTSDLEGVFLAVVAAAAAPVQERVFAEAQLRGILLNVVDVPGQCDFFYPAVVRRGDLQIAISTSGQSPVLAQRLRQQLERLLGEGYASWVAELGETRRRVLGSDLSQKQKQFLLHSLASREAFEAMAWGEGSQPSQGEGT
ncbi:MAG TPA: bifunctional precorrin-2 dehydrogenase/sirohydrochlorin ferrochelatase [Terriglobales bacterium]|nr:bifunctional precorrin-2 dehydrogenase/sirohydrochlorin ferrochelatase [Terriglobales bacterium]